MRLDAGEEKVVSEFVDYVINRCDSELAEYGNVAPFIRGESDAGEAPPEHVRDEIVRRLRDAGVNASKIDWRVQIKPPYTGRKRP